MSVQDYDLIVLGGGSGGLVSAAGAANFGLKVALIEKRDRLGGDCLLFGCVPSKTLIRSAGVANLIRRAGDFGLKADLTPPAGREVFGRVNRVMESIGRHDDAERWRAMGIDVMLGESAVFTGRDTLRVGDRELRGKKIIIATGSRPAVPPIPGIEDADCLTNETLFTEGLDEVPQRLLVIGGGPIGIEMAQAFHRLGAKVIVVETMECILRAEDEDVSCFARDLLVADGIDVVVRTRVASVARTDGGGGLEVTLASEGGADRTVVVDKILVAVGRRANVEGLGLEQAGVKVGPAGIVVDAKLRTSNPRIFGVGDVTGGFQFTHMAEAEARVALRNAFFPGSSKMDYRVVPWVTYMDPEIARVGASERELTERGVPFERFRIDLADVDRAETEGETRGFVKVLTDKRGRILGAVVAAPHGGDLIMEFVLAMKHGLKVQDVSAAIHPYPTLALADRKAADEYYRAVLFGKGSWKSRLLNRLARG